ncbi:MAG: hypothetical protein ETSY1_46340 (plasmid) [Candidatus Entotheonella factor]|uniref:Uncharacterized protein n=1 Tax=Entotheonella factor TaxID=1429438 RepID=W4M173_ENTF1|nr:MAG: hypothetical protein ETSY1_46340 [Candidatus Entotheonella factor]
MNKHEIQQPKSVDVLHIVTQEEMELVAGGKTEVFSNLSIDPRLSGRLVGGCSDDCCNWEPAIA